MKIGIMFCFVAVIVLMICILVILGLYGKLRRNYMALSESHHNLEALNSTLRAQRHDYLNHLQVVYGLMELQEYDDLRTYLDPVYKDIMKTGKALRTSKPALNALMKAKTGEAERESIDMYVEVKSDLKDLNVPDWELCKVLSNIIDNGITALKTKENNRKLCLDINESKEAYIFVISNNGPQITFKNTKDIFSEGVTSKQESGHGMGLFIVRKVMDEYHGEIKVVSDEQETSFIISFPKK